MDLVPLLVLLLLILSLLVLLLLVLLLLQLPPTLFSILEKLDRKPIKFSLACQDAFEGFAELHIEDCVDNGIDEGVDVTQPWRQLKGHKSRRAIQLQFWTYGVHDIAREERHPAKEEYACNDWIQSHQSLTQCSVYNEQQYARWCWCWLLATTLKSVNNLPWQSLNKFMMIILLPYSLRR